MHLRKPQLGVHADRVNGTCYSGQRFIYRIRTSHRCLPQASCPTKPAAIGGNTNAPRSVPISVRAKRHI